MSRATSRLNEGTRVAELGTRASSRARSMPDREQGLPGFVSSKAAYDVPASFPQSGNVAGSRSSSFSSRASAVSSGTRAIATSYLFPPNGRPLHSGGRACQEALTWPYYRIPSANGSKSDELTDAGSRAPLADDTIQGQGRRGHEGQAGPTGARRDQPPRCTASSGGWE
jgi:hypothetical protein